MRLELETARQSRAVRVIYPEIFYSGDVVAVQFQANEIRDRGLLAMVDRAVRGDPMAPETDLAPEPTPVVRPKPRAPRMPAAPRRSIATKPDPAPPAAKKPTPAQPRPVRSPRSKPKDKPAGKTGTGKGGWSLWSRIGKNKRRETSSSQGWDGTVWLIGTIPDGGIRDKGQTIDIVLNHNRREIQVSDMRSKADYTRKDHNIRVLNVRAMAALKRDFGSKYDPKFSGPLLTPDVDRVSSDKQLHRLRWTSDPDLAASWKKDIHHLPRDMVEYVPEHVYVESDLLGRFILLGRGLYVPGVYHFDWTPSEEEVDRPPIGDEDWELGPELDRPKTRKRDPVIVDEEDPDGFDEDDDVYPGDNVVLDEEEIDPADDADDLPPELSRAYAVDTSYRAIGPFQGWSGFFAGFSKGVNHRRHQYGPWGRDLSGMDVMWFYPDSGTKQRPEWPPMIQIPIDAAKEPDEAVEEMLARHGTKQRQATWQEFNKARQRIRSEA